MTPFTDEDLKRLKQAMGNCVAVNVQLKNSYLMAPERMLALLARLEAAEAVINWSVLCDCKKSKLELDRSHYDVWRKAAGK